MVVKSTHNMRCPELIGSIKQRPRQFLSCQQGEGSSGSECSAQCHSCMIFSLATFLLSNNSFSERSGVFTVGLVEFYTGDVWIQLFINQNVNNVLTFKFFTPEWWSSPSASLLNSIIMTNFILQINFFPQSQLVTHWPKWHANSDQMEVIFCFCYWSGIGNVVLTEIYWVPQWPFVVSHTK